MASTELVLPEVAKAAGIDLDTWVTMNQLYAGNKPESIALVARYCRARKLDPLRKPVHIVPMNVENKVTKKYEYIDVIMPGIQELRTTAARTEEMAGQDEPVFGPMIEVKIASKAEGDNAKTITVPEWCKVTVYRMVISNEITGEKIRVAYTATEFFDENVARTKEGIINSMWQKRSRGQLVKCTTAAAIRQGFPEESGGVMTMEEMQGKTIGSDAIEGEYTVIASGETGVDDITEPEDTGSAADAAAQSQDPPAQAQGAKKAEPTPAQKAEVKKAATEGKAETRHERTNVPVDHKLDIGPGPLRVLTNMLKTKGLTEVDLLAHFKKTIDMGTINEVLAWVRAQPDKE